MKWLLVILGPLVMAIGCTLSGPTAKQTHEAFDVVQTTFFGPLWNEAHARAAVVSQDGGESFVVPGGAIWAFGDTFKGSRLANGTPRFAGGAVSCAIAFLGRQARAFPPAFEYLCSSNGVVSPFEFLPEEKPVERYRIWPLGGFM